MQSTITNFANLIKINPSLQGVLEGMGASTHDMAGNLRDSQTLFGNFIDALIKDKPTDMMLKAYADLFGIPYNFLKQIMDNWPQFQSMQKTSPTALRRPG
jgi:hypothetical protein